MKIRTDFVTNSSSSSFVVDITVIDKEGNEHSVAIDPDDGGGNGNATLKCKAQDIAKASSIDDLIKLLSDSMYIGDEWEAEEEDMDYYRKRLSEYGDSLKADTKEMSNLDRIVLKRTWSAWGEGASCFGWNLDAFAEDLPELAKKVVESKGEEKEAAKKELEEYLANYDGAITSEWGGCFPDGFLGSKVKGAIVWNQFADSIEEFAQKVVSEDLPNDDYAEEITTIDLQKKKVVSQSAEYILGGHRSDDEEEWEEDEE